MCRVITFGRESQMIIQCEQCKTKFKLDDSKIKSSGVKVRCAKCRHIFTVMREEPAPEPQADFGAVFDQTSAFAGAAPSVEAFSQQREEPAPEPRTVQPPEIPAASASPEPEGIAGMDFSDFEPSREGAVAAEPPKPGFAPEPPAAQPETAPPAADAFSFDAGQLDFGEVDFGSTAVPARETPASPFGESKSDLAAPPSPQFESGGKFDELFGAPSTPLTGKEERAETFESAFGTKEIDFGADFSTAPVQREKPEEPKGGGMEFVFDVTPPPAAEPSAQTPVQPVTFDQPPAIPSVAPQPEPEVRQAPPQPVRPEPEKEQAPPAVAEEELPPLSISSRRKSSSLLKFLVLLLLVVAVGALGYFGKDRYKDQYRNLLQKIMPGASQETGKIVLRSINSRFVKNSITGGEVLIISGEAVNGYTTARGALQVKGMVYGEGDKILTSKNAYCGNPITPEQLATMPLEAVEAAMANQLGSALTNLEVAPGQAIPFSVVITSVPEGARNFGVEPAGSQAIQDKSK